uniref:BESS domain-containing protein n=1 Tax=Anopheles maculatus TaxID=74869 RepID=A0A182SCH1_9DIPT
MHQPSGSGYKHMRWKYLDQMSFLKDTLESRPRVNNLEAAEESIIEEYLDECENYESAGEVGKFATPEAIRSKPKMKTNQDHALQELVALEKEIHEMMRTRSEKSGNYHVMMSLVPLLDSLTEKDQMDAREEILRFTHRVIKEKKENYY